MAPGRRSAGHSAGSRRGPSPPHLGPRLRSLRRRRWRRLLLPAGLFLWSGAEARRARQQQRGRQEQSGGPREQRRRRRRGPHGGRARSGGGGASPASGAASPPAPPRPLPRAHSAPCREGPGRAGRAPSPGAGGSKRVPSPFRVAYGQGKGAAGGTASGCVRRQKSPHRNGPDAYLSH